MNKKDEPTLTFLSWNLYFGADLTPFVGATPIDIPERVTRVYRQVLATNYPLRVLSIAREIAAKKPDLIGLQEAVRWQLVIPNVRIVTYDFVTLLLKALEEQGMTYEVAVRNKNLSISFPDSHGNTVNFLDRDVILIRKCDHLKVIHTEAANFTTNLVVPVAGQMITLLRGWSAVDVKKKGQVFRLINTHLEPDSPPVREAQAAELLAGPANTNLPTILTGDYNDIPSSNTYNLIVGAGFQDVWSEIGIGSGFTAHQDSDVLDAVSALFERIDYIFYRKHWKPKKAELVGNEQQDRTRTGLWPSDHAGVVAKLVLKKW